jgi:hypothetical protein
MPNPIKYTTGTETLALKKGNFYIGTGDVGKGPSDVTGYYQGISPSEGGYVIYMNREGAPGDLSYHVAANDNELISFTNNLAGQSYTTVNECLVYYAGQSDKVVLNRNYEGIVTDGLVLNLDAGFTPSYPRSGTTWYDVSGSNNGTLTNGPTFDSGNGGSIVFDGVDDYSFTGYQMPAQSNTTSFAWNIWIYLISENLPYIIIFGNRFGAPYLNFQKITPTNWEYYDSIPQHIGYQIPIKEWRNICIVKNGENHYYYSNSILVGSRTTSLNLLTHPVYMGGQGTQENSNVIFSSAQIYNRALTATEVLQNYNAQKGRFGL